MAFGPAWMPAEPISKRIALLSPSDTGDALEEASVCGPLLSSGIPTGKMVLNSVPELGFHQERIPAFKAVLLAVFGAAQVLSTAAAS
jgi:hypothetical protein